MDGLFRLNRRPPHADFRDDRRYRAFLQVLNTPRMRGTSWPPASKRLGVHSVYNTERALRADVEIFTFWCRRRLLEAVPASAATVVAFIDAMARVKAPSTVRRYVSSIATLHKALGQTNPLESAPVRFALQRMHRRRGRRQAQVQGLTWPLRNRHAGGGRRPADRRPQPRPAGRGLRHPVAAIRAGVAGSV